MPISDNETLFQLIGTTYGGDGESTFALPNLQSRVPIHAGTGPSGTTYQLAEMAGTEQETLSLQQLPSHNHPALATANSGSNASPLGGVLAAPGTGGAVGGPMTYGSDPGSQPLVLATLGNAGGNQPHENCQPFLCVNFIISLFGIFPTQS